MQTLASRHLTTLTLNVDYAGMIEIGTVAVGRRRIAPVTGGTFEGERLSGVVLPGGADWVVNRSDGIMVLDVRLPLRTHDGAAIYLAYTGSYVASPEVMARLGRGEPTAPDEYRLRTVAKFEAGAEAYRWLNDLIVVGTGTRMEHGPVYELFEIL